MTSGFQQWMRPLAAGLGAFVVTVALTPLVIRLARRRGWIARPTADRWHGRPTALMGGLAIFAGSMVAWLLFPTASWSVELGAGATILLLTGVVDDLRGLSPAAKLVAQVAAATLVLLAGRRLAPGWPAWLSVSLTYLWVIGITNAVNLLDNMDGLAAGIVAIAAGTAAVLAGVAGAWPEAAPALATAGAAAGFLVFNRPPARIFMGDGGSLFLGYSIAALAVAQPGAGASGTAAVLAVPAAVMAVPILDTTLVTIRRLASGRSIAQGGRDHSSHRLVFLGLSERRAVLTLYGVAGAFSVLAVCLRALNVYLELAVSALAAVALGVFGVFLGQVRVEGPGRSVTRKSRPGAQGRSVLLRPVVLNGREIALILADLLLVVASFMLSHYLRFEGGLPAAHLVQMLRVVPFVVLVKIGTLFALGAYRGLLRYAGSEDLIRVVEASSVASGLLVVGLVLLFRFEGFSRSVFVIDWIVTTSSLVALRGAFRGLQSYFAARRRKGESVLIYGAGDAGYLALREMRQNPELGLVPVGFLDDDSAKQRHVLHGLPVLGGGHDMERLCRGRGVREVVVAISSLEPDVRRRIQERCAEAGVKYRELRVELSPKP